MQLRVGDHERFIEVVEIRKTETGGPQIQNKTDATAIAPETRNLMTTSRYTTQGQLPCGRENNSVKRY
jgi:hypothetical protein